MGSARPGLLVAAIIAALAAIIAFGACNQGSQLGSGVCLTNHNCRTGEECVGGRCMMAATGGCRTSDTCPIGQICDTTMHMCMAVQVTGCTNDSACPSDQKCNTLTGVCIVGRRSCTGDAQCTSIGKHCDTTHQQCVDCVLNTDCQSPKICTQGSCIDPSQGQCTQDSMCAPPNTVCQAQQCVSGCQVSGSPIHCGVGQVCDTNTGRCAAGMTTCTQDTDCHPPSSICISGQCIPGCGQPAGLQCTGGDTCNTMSGRCDPPSSSCTMDSMCGAPARVCTNSMCVPGCGQTGGAPCAPGTVCNTTTGHCTMVQGPCTMDSQCMPPSTVCESMQCIPGCGHAGGIQCTGAQTCNTTTGRCMGGTPGCTMDSQCMPPTTICNTANGMCTAGCLNTGCTSPMTCNMSTGHCMMGMPPPPPGGAALNATCTQNTDCASSVCFDFGSSIGKHCVSSCGTSGDCPASFTCYDFNGAKMCVSSQQFMGATFAAADGAPCTGGGDCRSNFCLNNVCVDTCDIDQDCGGGLKCKWASFASNMYEAACNGPAGTGANGSTCMADSTCRSGVCYGSGICGDLCGTSSECPANNICIPVNYSVCVLTFVTCQVWQPNYVKACVNPMGMMGAGTVGTACTQGAQCRSGLCDTVAGKCTDTCSRDRDCPTSDVCGVALWDTLSDGTQIWANVCKARGTN